MHQGKGIGKMLIKRLFRQSKTNNINRFYSHVSIIAKPLFAHFTFNEVKQQQVSIRGQVLTNYVMKKLSTKRI